METENNYEETENDYRETQNTFRVTQNNYKETECHNGLTKRTQMSRKTQKTTTERGKQLKRATRGQQKNK